MKAIHKKLAQGRWRKFSLAEQLSHIGSEVNRAIHWQQVGEKENMEKAAWRVLELIDLTISDRRWRKRLLEIVRLREVFCDKFLGQDIYHTSIKAIQDYFLFFALAHKK